MATAADSIVDLSTADALEANRRDWSFFERHGLMIVCASPVLANAIGSIFNIFYNRIQTEPMLSVAQQARFDACVQVFNVIVYPIAIVCYALPLFWLRPVHKALLNGEAVEPERLVKAQRYVVNLPWWFLTVTAFGWWSCIPVFPAALQALPEELNRAVIFHLVSSFLIASLIAIPQSFFAVEMASQKALFPVFFRRENPARVPGGKPINMTTRGLMWVVSTVVCPVVSLMLLLLDPAAAKENPAFGAAVAVISIVYALVTGWMIIKLVVVPVRQLRHAAMQVAKNNLDIRINLLRADDFGHLIERMNLMIEGLREREQLQETFGRHVGQEAAKQILQQDSALVGTEQTISVMFVDVRNFTEHSSRHSPQEVVAVLNIFFREAVDKIESRGGMVNKFLGDGFMALFGIGAMEQNHAQQAVDAGLDMLCCLEETAHELEQAGWPGLAIGIGINTGPAIVGSIGSPKRQEYTAIGDTVNVASRVESLTKVLGCPILVTAATRNRLDAQVPVRSMPPQSVKGKGTPLQVFSIET
ncbi:MAG: adenylate/guanylate cyclase domain-containing protein [Planctomycetota bacterium]